MTLLLGLTCPEGDKVQYRTFPPRHSPGHCRHQNHQEGSLSSPGNTAIIGRPEGPFLLTLGDGFRRIDVARRQGVSEMAGTVWVCQVPNYQARSSANKATWVSQTASLPLVSCTGRLL